ncbi:MAG: alanine racemase, partial [Proteobacteria bacterium]|nr:alanine racemase [Pseudomonadota bacterium]
MNRPTVAEIDLAALRHNVSRINRLSTNPSKMLAIVKANAYGHGAVNISRELVNCGTDYLGVAICEEAAELRHAGLQVPIMVMGGIYSGQEEVAIKYNLVPVIFDITTARSLNAIASQNGITIKVHIKLDTGMGRIGIMPNDLDTFFQSLKACNNLVVDGLLTHLSAADACIENSDNFTCRQIDM